MPIFDLHCLACDRTEERYLNRWDSPNPTCEICGSAQERLVSRFAMPFIGSVHKYVDIRKENSHMDGFWDYRVKSSISGNMEPVFLSTMQEVRDFNRAEGLTEVSTQCSMSTDGKTLSSAGMPGQWHGGGMPSIPARLQEIINLRAEDIPQAAATATPCMPASYGVTVQVTEAPPEVGQS